MRISLISEKIEAELRRIGGAVRMVELTLYEITAPNGRGDEFEADEPVGYTTNREFAIFKSWLNKVNRNHRHSKMDRGMVEEMMRLYPKSEPAVERLFLCDGGWDDFMRVFLSSQKSKEKRRQKIAELELQLSVLRSEDEEI